MWPFGRLRTGGGSEEAGASRGGRESGRMKRRGLNTLLSSSTVQSCCHQVGFEEQE